MRGDAAGPDRLGEIAALRRAPAGGSPRGPHVREAVLVAPDGPGLRSLAGAALGAARPPRAAAERGRARAGGERPGAPRRGDRGRPRLPAVRRGRAPAAAARARLPPRAAALGLPRRALHG